MLRRPRRLQLQSTLVPTRRQRAVSAAVDRTPTAQVQSGRPLQLLPLLRTARWRLVEVCHSTSTSPTRREATRTRRGSLPPDVCTDAHGTHAHLARNYAVWRAAGAAGAVATMIDTPSATAQLPAAHTHPTRGPCHSTAGFRRSRGCSPLILRSAERPSAQ